MLYEIIKDGEIVLCYSFYTYIDGNFEQFEYLYKTKEIREYNSILKENHLNCSTDVINIRIIDDVKMNRRVGH